MRRRRSTMKTLRKVSRPKVVAERPRYASMQSYDIGEGLQPDIVEREIAAGSRRLAFARPIETLFERNGREARARVMTITTLVGVLVYDLFLVLDQILLPDVFAMMVVARIGIFTPFALGMLWIARRHPTRFRMEGSSVVCGLLSLLLPTLVLAQSDSVFKLNYRYTNVLIMMFVAVVQQNRFRYALIALVSSIAIHFSVIFWWRMFDVANSMAIVMFYSTCLIHLSIAAYIIEYHERRSFLFGLHATLLREQITRAARTDALTGLFNRRYLAEYFDALAPSPPVRTILAILLDIDHFKAFNDSRGHIEGDDCLRRVSAGVAAVAARRGGVTFRFGGEEILILVQGMELADGMQLAEAVRAAIEATAIPHPALGAGRVVTASLGVAGGLVPGIALSDLVAAADTALYAAKRAGRNRALPGPVPVAAEQDGPPSHRSEPGDTVAPAAILC
ncbi:diguanylate cyclase [Methylobacterium sp. WL8]|nr:diguanylate cyclase [Methylobacterium sp. WL8]